MKNKKIFLVSLIVTLLVSSWMVTSVTATALSEETLPVFKVINNSERDVTVILTGPTESYEIEVGQGKENSIHVVRDKYWVEYPSCNDTLDFEADLTENNYTLQLYPCANQPSKLQVKSHLSEDVVFELYGYRDYEFDIEPGFNKVNLFSGNYTYSYDACGTTFTGEVNVGKNGDSQIYLHSCEWFQDPVRVYGTLNVVSFKIINQASFPIYLTLIGRENYLVTVNPGVNIYKLVTGSYKYSYYLDYKINTGTFTVTTGGTGSLVLSPSHVYNFADDTNLE